MSDISRDLQDQRNAGLEPLLRRFLEKKPEYDGAMLTADDEDRLRRESLAETQKKVEMFERQIKERAHALRRL